MKKLNRRIIAMLLVIVMALSMLPTALAADGDSNFKDVSQSHWAYDYVEMAVALGLFQGTSADTFTPAGPMTRGMFVTVLNRLSGEVVDNNVETEFTDVTAGAYYAGAVAWAVEKGITTGTSATTFAPDAAVTRQQAATFLARYADAYGISLPQGEPVEFTDADAISEFAKGAVDVMALAGLITGYPDGSFKPLNTITRGEAAALLVRFWEASQPEEFFYPVSFMANNAVITIGGKETTFTTISNLGSVTFAVEVEEGYELVSVNASTGVLVKNEDGTWTLSEVADKVIVSVITKAPEAATYTVDFTGENKEVTVDGEAVTEVTVAEGESITFAAKAAEGFILSQVVASAGDLTDNGDGTWTLSNITEDITVAVVAVLDEQLPVEPETYTITFVTDEGVKVLVDGQEITEATVTSNDLTFLFNYQLTAEHTQIYTVETTPEVNVNVAGNAYVLSGIKSDITVNITTGIETFTVTFITDNNATQVATQTVDYMSLVEVPEAPEMEGYFFGGWYKDMNLFYDYDFNTPVTSDVVLYAGFGQELERVYLGGNNASNYNDGATPETPVAGGSWATKLAAHSTTKEVIIQGMIYVTAPEVWDASQIEGGVTAYVSDEYKDEYSAYLLYVEGHGGTLYVNNWNFFCNRTEDNIKGNTFLITARYYERDEDGNQLYDENGDVLLTFGEATLVNCSADGFGTLPKGGGGYGSFSHSCISNYGSVTIIGGKYSNNLSTDGGFIHCINDTSSVYVDGAEIYGNEARYCEGIPYADGNGGVFSSTNLKLITFKNCYIHDNQAENGGVFHIGNGQNTNLENNIFENNVANGAGGVVAIEYGVGSVVNLTGNNQFLNNKAGSGGALYLYNAQTIGEGTFRGNEAAVGNAIYCLKDVTIDPVEGGTLALDGSIFIATSAGIKLAGSVANNDGILRYEMPVATPGAVVATGVNGYVLTEADLAKIGCEPEAELVLKTDTNTINVYKAESGGGEGGDVGEDDGPHDLAVVYLSGKGNDANDGATAATAVKTFGQAKRLLAKDGIIYITGTVDAKGETWSMDPEIYGNAKVVRHADFITTSAALVNVTTGLTLKNIHLDGNEINTSSASAIKLNGAATVILDEGTVLENIYSGGVYNGVIGGSSGTIFINEGATIRNCSASGTYGGIICGDSIVMTGGTISGCTVSGTYCGVLYGAVNISGGKLTNNTGSGSYSYIIYTDYMSTLTISGTAEISNNTTKAPAVTGGSSGKVFMTGGSIINNTATGTSYSAGLIIPYNTPAELTGGVISGNTGMGNGGAIYVNGGASSIVNIDGITIENNSTTKNGGAVYIGTTGTVNFKSGKISGNQAALGDELYIGKDGIVTFAPTASGLTIDGEIYLANSANFKTNGNKVGDLTNLNGMLKFNFAKIASDSVVAVPVEGYTLTEADLAKIGSIFCKISYELREDGKIYTKTVPVESVVLDKTEMTVMATYTDTLTATLAPLTASNLSVTWKSSDTSVATVSGNLTEATVTGKKPGTVTITATADGGAFAECVVTVTENTTPIESITLSKEYVHMESGDTVSLSATVAPWNAYDTTVTWTSSDDSVVFVNGRGSSATVTAMKDGNAVVTATTADGKTAQCQIEISDTYVTGITLDTKVEVAVGDTASLTSVIAPSNATVQDVTWTCADPNVAELVTYGANAVVYGKKTGTTSVTVTTVDGGFKATAEINVVASTVENTLSLDITNLKLINFQHFNITALFENSLQDVTWTTSNPEVVLIEKVNGNQITIQAQDAGSAVITATAADGQTAECVVTVSIRVAGTQDEVYVNGDRFVYSDNNDGLTPETAVLTLEEAISRLAVNGTIHIYEDSVALTPGANISLPKEVYGDAKIVMHSTVTYDERWPGHVREEWHTPGFIINNEGTYTFSDVTIDYSGAGQGNNLFSSRDGVTIIFSEGLQLIGNDGKQTQGLFYVIGGDVIINGGLYKDFQGTSYGSFGCTGGHLQINGGRFENIGCNSLGGLACVRDEDAKITVNGGEFVGCYSKRGTGGVLYAREGIVNVYGGKFIDSSASPLASAAIQADNDGILTIKAKYDLKIEDGIQLASTACRLNLGSLHRLDGVLKLTVATGIRANAVVASGANKTLTWEEWNKVELQNSGYSLILDTETNALIAIK